MTFLTSPVVTFYRADVMEENGFPSEPEELAKFIEKSENLMAIAKKLNPRSVHFSDACGYHKSCRSVFGNI